MNKHYDAFISYKHEPEDIQIAKEVQRSLERYKIPEAIKKQTGYQKIERVFRDTDELSLTSDLSDTIKNALDNTDHLIVICSTKTRQSEWVQREIEYFLKDHTRKDILTVVVNGEPSDVVPEILQYEEITVTDEDGNTKTERKTIEPLSCDYRMSIKQARKIELPRLVSALIGCSYDDLMNRQKAYATKKLIYKLVTTIVIGTLFMFQLLYGIAKINKNYQTALKNQAKYLANESLNKLKDEQRITALKLAMEAVPNDRNNSIPITPEAERALIEATSSYKPHNALNYVATWIYTFPDHISSSSVTEDGKHLVTLDSRGYISITDAETHERIYAEKTNDHLDSIKIVSNNTLIAWSFTDIYAFDLLTGKQKYTVSNVENSINALSILGTSEDSFYYITDNFDLYEISNENGEVINKDHIDFSKENYYFATSYALSESKNKLAISILQDDNSYRIITYDRNTKKSDILEQKLTCITKMYWYNDKNLFVSEQYESDNQSLTIDNTSIYAEESLGIKCFDAEKGTEKWNRDFTCSDEILKFDFVSIPDSENILFYAGNLGCTYNINSGKQINTYHFNDSIIYNDKSDDGGWPAFFTSEGGYCILSREDNSNKVTMEKLFPNNADKIIRSKDGYYISNEFSNEIDYYSNDVYDEDWVKFADLPENFYHDQNCYFFDNLICLMYYSSDYKSRIAIYDMNTKELNTDMEISANELLNTPTLLGIYDDKLYLSYLIVNDDNNYSYYLATIDLDSYQKEVKELFVYSDVISAFSNFSDDKIVYVQFKDEENVTVHLMNLNNNTEDTYDVSIKDACQYVGPAYIPQSNSIYLSGSSDILINTVNKKVNKIKHPKGWKKTQNISNVYKYDMMLTDNEQIIVVDTRSGEVKKIISRKDYTVCGMYFIKPEKKQQPYIAVVFENDLGIFDYKSGNYINETSINIQGYVNFYHDQINNNLYIYSEDFQRLSVVNTQSWVETINMETSGYCKEKDIFFTIPKSDEEDTNVVLGYYKHYSIDELMEKGKNLLQGQELTPEEKSHYGID